MESLDRTEQRIVGVLIEKQLTVPDTYPLSENALVAGCNQKSNRDPHMELESFQIAGALFALHEKEVVARVEGGGRVPKYRHKLDERLAVGDQELPVLAELLLRGPQAPGALKPRVARMGMHATPDQVLAVLRGMAAQLPPLVRQLPHRPRERDQRWQHLLGDSSEVGDAASTAEAQSRSTASGELAQPSASPVSSQADLAARMTALEQRVRALEQALGTTDESADGTDGAAD